MLMKDAPMTWKRLGFIILLWILACFPQESVAALFEQLVVETRAQSLAGSVTADPQGPLSAHFNPAGLDRVRGTELAMGVSWIPVLNIKSKYTQAVDPTTGKLWAPFGGYFNNGIDPEAGHDSSTRPYIEIPVIGALPFNIMAGANQGIAYHAKGSSFAFGFALYAPFAVGMEHTDPTDPARFLGKSTSIVRMVLAPTISYRVTKTISVGASFGFGLARMSMDTRMRSPNELVALTGALGEATVGLELPVISELTLPAPWFGGGISGYEDIGGLKFSAEDDMTTSFNVGFLWEPFSWLSIGGVYQSESKAELKGKYTLDYSKRFQKTVNWLGSSPTTIIVAAMLDLPTYAPEEHTGNMSLDIMFPARAQFGIALKPHRRVKFLVDANWTQWSRWENIEIKFDRRVELFRLTKLMGYTGGDSTMKLENGFKDTIHPSFGLELEPIDGVFLRFGYDARPTSIQDSYFGPIPLGDMKIYTFGFGIETKNISFLKPPERRYKGLMDLALHQLLHADRIDFGVTYMTAKAEISSNTSQNYNSTDFTKPIYNPFAGIDYENELTNWIINLNMTFRF
jgi:long-subunit fatty acid transport protein